MKIQSSLSFVEEAENGIRFSYKSSDTAVLSGYGLIMAEEIPKEGLPVTLTITLSYKDRKKDYETAARIFGNAAEQGYLERLRKALEDADSKSIGLPVFVLPTVFEGEEIAFTEETISPWIILLLFGAAAAGILLLPKEQRKKQYRLRNEALEQAFPGLVLKLQLLIGAGLSIRSAVLKAAKDYEEEKASGSVKQNYAYEELLRTAHELESGASETESYLNYGRRCRVRRYVRLGNTLSQSVRQGISGLEGTLREEAQQALEERKAKALQKGAEAGTKQLFPMILMLGIIIVMLVVPTLMTF